MNWSDEKTIQQFLEFKREVSTLALGKPMFACDLSWRRYLQICKAYFNPQAYGARVEARLIQELNLERVPASLDRGDSRFDSDFYIEIKTSFISPKGEYAVVQIRQWQDIQAYLILLVPENFDAIVLIIPTMDMHKISDKYASNAHMTGNTNDKRELRLTITPTILEQLIQYKI